MMCDHKIYSGCRKIGSRFRYTKTGRRTAGTEERKNMKNKEFKKGIAIGVASTLVVTGTVLPAIRNAVSER